jgi:capsular polysaccharide biosynthesis protein
VSETRDTPPGADLDAEREVDLRAFWSRLAHRWWLPVGGAVLGAIVGVLFAVGGGDVFQAKTLVYLGQPYTPGGGSQIGNLTTNVSTVNEIIRSEAALKDAATASGLRVGQLRGNVRSDPVEAPGQVRGVSPIVEITVQAPQRAKAETAADTLAREVTTAVAQYVEDKVVILERSFEENKREIAATQERIEFALRQSQLAVDATDLSLAERLLIQANANNTLQFYEARQSNLRSNLNSLEQLLSLARNVEQSRVIEPAVGVRTVATSRRNAALVGGVIGLLLGSVGAYVWEPIARRRRAPA